MGVKNPKRNSNTALSRDQVRALLGCIEDGRDYAIVRLALEAAVRVNEFATLSPANINYDASTIRVWDQKKDTKNGKARPNKKYRTIDMDRHVLEEFREFENQALGLSAATYERIIHKYSTIALGYPVSWHSLRHTWTTLSLNSGRSIKYVARKLGDTEATVAQYYHDLSPEQLRRERSIKIF